MFGFFKKKKPAVPKSPQDLPTWGAPGKTGSPATGGKLPAEKEADATDSKAGTERSLVIFAAIANKAEQARVIDFGKALASEAAKSASKAKLGTVAEASVQVRFDTRRTDAAALRQIADQSFKQLRTQVKPALMGSDYAGISFAGDGKSQEQLLLTATPGRTAGPATASHIKVAPGQEPVSKPLA